MLNVKIEPTCYSSRNSWRYRMLECIVAFLWLPVFYLKSSSFIYQRKRMEISGCCNEFSHQVLSMFVFNQGQSWEIRESQKTCLSPSSTSWFPAQGVTSISWWHDMSGQPGIELAMGFFGMKRLTCLKSFCLALHALNQWLLQLPNVNGNHNNWPFGMIFVNNITKMKCWLA